MGSTPQSWIKRKANGNGTPWNKGLKLPSYSDERKKEISERNKRIGLTPPSWKGKKRSPESVERSAAKRRGVKRLDCTGEKNFLWKGGITKLSASVRTCMEYRQWKSDVFTRDDFTCQKCGERGVYLHAHHIRSFATIMTENDIKSKEQALLCEELWNINNGQTLCVPCHKITDSYLNRAFNGVA